MSNVIAVIAALGGLAGIASFIGAVVTLMRARAEREELQAKRKQIDACTSEKITATALTLVKPLEERVKAVEVENAKLRNAYQRMLRGVRLLIRQLQDAEIEPVWTPEQELDPDIQA